MIQKIKIKQFILHHTYIPVQNMIDSNMLENLISITNVY